MNLAKSYSRIFSAFLLAFSMSISHSWADELKSVYNEIAQKLIDDLPIHQKMSIKSLRPEESGLPEDFLLNLISNLEESLLEASDFEINLVNRLSLESVWEEAIEFNNLDFEEILGDTKSDILLMVSPRAIADGIEISITAYELSDDNTGKILTSTGTKFLPIDLGSTLGVNVTNLNEQMGIVINQIQKIGKSGGIISEPTTYAEYYHNARIYRQRGETDLALRNFEQAINSDLLFVDPVEDLLSLAVARYGQSGAQQYYLKKIRTNLPSDLQIYGDLFIGSELLDAAKLIASGGNIFSPYMSLFMRRHEGPYGADEVFKKAWKRAIQQVHEDYRSGTLQSYYVDSFRAVAGGELASRWSNLAVDL
jgi:tetratricopeptide (TPR) repeat protein